MKLARGLERRLEALVDGIAAKLFRGRIHPLELAARLIREADLALADGPAGPVAPNRFRVAIGGETAADADPRPAETVLAETITETAIERGWRLEGPVDVEIVVAPGETGVRVEATVERGVGEAWAFFDPAEGEPLIVRPNRAIIGRSASGDVHVAADDVSRHHALVWREAGRIWLADLGSSNGTRINGHLIDRPTEVFSGDTIAVGEASFRFRVA
jgi:hypothetical protein